nr:3585_t:CDS:2 [Entrophospora candida]
MSCSPSTRRTLSPTQISCSPTRRSASPAQRSCEEQIMINLEDKMLQISTGLGNSLQLDLTHTWAEIQITHHNRKILRGAAEIGKEQPSHVKIKRKRWYDDDNYADKSKPPEMIVQVLNVQTGNRSIGPEKLAADDK